MRKTIATILCLALLAMTAAGCADTATNVFSSLAGLAPGGRLVHVPVS